MVMWTAEGGSEGAAVREHGTLCDILTDLLLLALDRKGEKWGISDERKCFVLGGSWLNAEHHLFYGLHVVMAFPH